MYNMIFGQRQNIYLKYETKIYHLLISHSVLLFSLLTCINSSISTQETLKFNIFDFIFVPFRAINGHYLT